jgi:hypothetical protein
MKRIFTILLIYLIASKLSAQNTLAYYKKINEGKEFVIQNNIKSAVVAYKQALEDYPFAFARDCYNAIELAVLAKDTTNLIFFIEKAITQGIRITDLETTELLTPYQNSAFYKNIKKNQDGLWHIYTARINWELRAEINQMFTHDQKMRALYYKAAFYKRKSIAKEWQALNVRQVERLVEITKTYGFPGERLIGLDKNDMHPKIITNNFSAGMPIVILIHHFSKPNKSYYELFLNEVKKGNLHNEHFATICDFEAEFGNRNAINNGYYGVRFKPKKPDDNLNSKRKSIGLMKLEQIEELNKTNYLTKYWNRLY